MIKVNIENVSVTACSFKEQVDVGDKTLGLGRVITNLRQRKGLRQQDVAEAIGIGRPALANIEAGRQNFSVMQLYAIADAIGLTVTITFEDKL